MKTFSTAVATALTVICAFPVMAADPQQVSWVDLLPEERPYHDPFLEMEYSQLGDLARLFRMEYDAEEGDVMDEATKAETIEIRTRLEEQGLDPDYLFKQREIVMNQRRIAATEPNPDLIGKSVRLPGYILPLEMEGQKTVEFLLVPTVGACIHTPPPPANQIVLVNYAEGFEVDGFYTPVWISGEMQAQSQTSSIYLVDGDTDVETTYVLDALSVEIYE